MELTHLMCVPFTGLGLYNGFRGNRWLRNRIKVFKQFVVPSLQAQVNQNFKIWVCWRYEERDNKQVIELMEYLKSIFGNRVIATFSGIPFYDDKYPPEVARKRIIDTLHGCTGQLTEVIGDVDYVLMTIQPSDDCYHKTAIQMIQSVFYQTDLEAFGFKKGYIMNYTTKEVAEYNPTTNPPFYTLKFPRADFIDPLKHIEFTTIKKDVGQYPKGTPLPSHEYVGDCLKYGAVEERGFLVGTHGVNISTTWQIPFKGEKVSEEVLKDFGLYEIPPIKIPISLFKKMFIRLPHKVQRKLRYIWTEKLRI